MRVFRFAISVAGAWALLACALPVIREMPIDGQWWLPLAGVLFGLIAVTVGFRFARDHLVIFGFVTIVFFSRLWLVLPLGRERFDNSATFDIPWASALREQLRDAADGLPGAGNQLVPGLAVGDTTLVSPSLSADMKTVSLTHLVAVSGANCAIITAGVIAVVALCGGGRWMRALAATVALTLFVAIVGPQPSVIRATVMAVILLVSVSSGHPSRGVPVLALAAFVLLLVDPTWATNIGFTLSVLATAALLVLAPRLEETLSAHMPRWLATVIAIPLSAELVCQPVVATLTPGLPLFGIVANVLATPAAPIATVTGLIAALVLPLAPPVGTVLVWLCWLPAQWIAIVANLCAHLPFARLLWPGGTAGVLLSLVLSAALITLLTWPKARRLSAMVVVLTLGVSLTTTVVAQTWRHIGLPDDWLIAMCDIGQGDALLIRPSPNSNHVMLIDTGRDEILLRRCLDDLRIGRIELLVLTHYDQDHVGAYAVLLGRVDRALVGKPQDVSEVAVIRDLESAGAQVEYGRAGLRGELGEPGFLWRDLWPTVGHPDMQTGNPGSLVIRAEWSPTSSSDDALSAIFLGDLGEDAQRALLTSTPIRPVDVVKVAHHGSADQFDVLYSRLRARVALVSVGKENGYGHPTDRALTIMANSGSPVARTDQQGLVLVRRVGSSPGTPLTSHIEVWSER